MSVLTRHLSDVPEGWADRFARALTCANRRAKVACLAESGCTAHEIMAITGHAGLSQVERYTRQAEQRTRAEAAMIKRETHRKR